MAESTSCMSFPASPSFLKCVKCLTIAVEPVVTSCYHTLCRACYNVAVKEGDGSVLECPFCGCNGAGNSPPPSNVFADFFRETFTNRLGTAFVHKCSICNNNEVVIEAVKVCLDCPSDRFLCQSCSKQHSSFPILSSHSLIPVEDYVEGTEAQIQGEEMCPVHPSKCVDTECSTCGVRMCVVCSMAKTCPKAVAPLTAHTIMDKEAINMALKRDIEKVSEDCSMNVEEVDRLMKGAHAEVSAATADAVVALKKLDDHREAVRDLLREEGERTEKHMGEMRSQLEASHQERIDECRGMVKKLTYVRQANERGKVLGERVVFGARKEDWGRLLAEVLPYQISAPAIAASTSSVLVFTGPDLMEIQKKMESVGGSLMDHSQYPPVINHRVLLGAIDYDIDACHRMGSSLIEASESKKKLWELDDKGVRRVILSGYELNSSCSTSDGAQLLAVRCNPACFYTFKRDSSGTLQNKNYLEIPGSGNFYGVSVSNSGLAAVTDDNCIHVLNTEGKKVMSVGPSVGRKRFGQPLNSVWSHGEKYLYVTKVRNATVSVVCIDMITDSIQWETAVSEAYNIHLVRGELYVIETRGSDVTVLNPKNGSKLRTHKCPGTVWTGIARGVYDDDGKVTIVSYK